MYYYYESDMVSDNPFEKPVFFFIFLSSVDGTGYNRKPTESSVTAGHSILYA